VGQRGARDGKPGLRAGKALLSRALRKKGGGQGKVYTGEVGCVGQKQKRKGGRSGHLRPADSDRPVFGRGPALPGWSPGHAHLSCGRLFSAWAKGLQGGSYGGEGRFLRPKTNSDSDAGSQQRPSPGGWLGWCARQGKADRIFSGGEFNTLQSDFQPKGLGFGVGRGSGTDFRHQPAQTANAFLKSAGWAR